MVAKLGISISRSLYYVEGDNIEEEELEVRDFFRNERWDEVKLRRKFTDEMENHILENIRLPNDLETNDSPWWIGNSQGRFTVKST